VVPGPPAVEEMSRPRSGLALRREDGRAVQWDSGLTDLHRLEGWQHWRG
jgi:hypothetical protein